MKTSKFQSQADQLFALAVAIAAFIGFSLGAITCREKPQTSTWNPDPHEWMKSLETAPIDYPSATTIMRGGVILSDDVVVERFAE